LESFAAALLEEGIPLLVVHLSLEYRLPAFGEQCSGYADFLEMALEDWCVKNDAPFLSSGKLLNDQFDGPRPAMLFSRDSHPSPEGHRMLAERIKPWLRDQLSESGAGRS
jgi:lysophospholipase L1-like esterase